ncbi:hydrogenase maturation nickel metallochaperone HypA [Corynebacterium breve]|uniref:Hydrogenase maturation nickel metallochaperone HypA n=1 Tax=Corynebacterium breve TaxID=3049799 RepID=A0ABY8VGT2_9CORY|nr:hydrogenase maturation nickel metallochaperone HypA [Corynebacterium breve]WIM68287.1 hydrogenase maturation nickel metallochaperone HypA [Corynebacterium breve]
MHEVALATQLSHVVARHAEGRRVCAVDIEVGALRQVVPATLAYAWRFVVKDTVLQDAQLNITWVDAEIACSSGHHTRLDATDYLDVRCPTCASPTTVIAGEEFRVIDIEVDLS